MMAEPDRINVSLGMKLPGPVDFSSVNFSVSYSSDLKEGESQVKAFKRVRSFVETKVEELTNDYGNLQAPGDEEEYEEDGEEGECEEDEG